MSGVSTAELDVAPLGSAADATADPTQIDVSRAPTSGATPNDTEDRARRMGWLPREEFRGEPAAWRPADEFLARGETILPVLQQQLRAIDSRYGGLQKEFASYREETARTLAQTTDMLRKADERAYQRALREVEAKREAALTQGDQAAFAAADRERDALRETAPAPPDGQAPAAPAPRGAPASPAPSPEIVAWAQANPWFNSDPEARADAISLFGRMEQDRPDLSLMEKLAETRRKVARLHPQLFGNPRATAPSPVSSPTAAPSRPANPRSFDALPTEVKGQFDRYAKQLEGKGKPLTKEEWASYYWENEA